MRVLALYDIHGNVDALDAVLADPAAQAVDAVVVGGDVVPGPFARAALDRLAALGLPVHRLRGNGEREVAEVSGVAAPEAEDDEALPVRTARLSLAEVGQATARELAALPLTLELDGVRYVHASPRRDDEMLTRASPDERYAEALADVAEPLVVAGHTHQVHDRTVGGVRYVNAGSVGLPYEGDGAARWLLVVDGLPEPHVTAYDSAGAGRRMLATGWPDGPSVGAALVEPIDPATITGIFEDSA